MPVCHLPAQAVRDLDWVLTSPSLVRPIPEASLVSPDLTSTTRQWLQMLHQDPTPLLAHLHQRNTRRLGNYFESLWEFWLQHQPHLQLISQRQQIYHQGKTVGEFDFIIWDEQLRQHRHQELAVKFYLGIVESPHDEPQTFWKGPNAIDRLDLKLAKLRHQQLRLREHPIAQQWLHTRGITNLVPELLLKGYLFYPLEQSVAPPAVAGDHHLRGKWLYLKQLEQLLPQGEHWLVLAKTSWLSPARALAEHLLSVTQLRDRVRRHFETSSQAILLAALKEHQGVWQESERYFVVADSWPGPRD